MLSAPPFSVTISLDAQVFVRTERLMSESLEKQLIEELSGFGIDVTGDQAHVLVAYLNLVIEKNKVLNLTRITEPTEAVTLHLVDSLLPLASPHVQVSEKDHLLDMGTGAGFPGVPFGVITKAEALLVDSVGKKTTAVQEFVDTLGLANISTRHARLEELAREIPQSQNLVLARAVAKTYVLLEYATPFLVQSGKLVIEKGRPDDAELFAAEQAAKICGLKLVSRETFDLPRKLGHREILTYQKVRKSQIKLPRRNGLAREKPLGETTAVSRETSLRTKK